jgi:predicted 3-demethylubiquinone-9 3-methyltransferase (glyoxalase superfamily)
MSAQVIVPNIWCNANAEEAGQFYTAVFDAVPFAGASAAVEGRYPSDGLPEFQREFAGRPLVVGLTVAGFRFVLINAGPQFRPNPSISFILNFDPLLFGDPGGDEGAARDALDRVWERLANGGEVLMPLDAQFFSQRYGWVQDRFGVGWQLILTNPQGDPRPFIMPALTFGGPAQNRAGAAIEHYCDVFANVSGGAAAGMRMPYGPAAGAGPADPDALMFAEFRIGEQWFAAFDAGRVGTADFDCGVSFEVDCADQGEIDRLWAALSAVPAAEQCGWLVDRFGVSWQIVPANLAELMVRPGAYEHLMGLGKIVIANL